MKTNPSRKVVVLAVLFMAVTGSVVWWRISRSDERITDRADQPVPLAHPDQKRGRVVIGISSITEVPVQILPASEHISGTIVETSDATPERATDQLAEQPQFDSPEELASQKLKNLPGLKDFHRDRDALVAEITVLLQKTEKLPREERLGQIGAWRTANGNRLRVNREKAALYGEQSADDYAELVRPGNRGPTAIH